MRDQASEFYRHGRTTIFASQVDQRLVDGVGHIGSQVLGAVRRFFGEHLRQRR